MAYKKVLVATRAKKRALRFVRSVTEYFTLKREQVSPASVLEAGTALSTSSEYRHRRVRCSKKSDALNLCPPLHPLRKKDAPGFHMATRSLPMC